MFLICCCLIHPLQVVQDLVKRDVCMVHLLHILPHSSSASSGASRSTCWTSSACSSSSSPTSPSTSSSPTGTPTPTGWSTTSGRSPCGEAVVLHCLLLWQAWPGHHCSFLKISKRPRPSLHLFLSVSEHAVLQLHQRKLRS